MKDWIIYQSNMFQVLLHLLQRICSQRSQIYQKWHMFLWIHCKWNKLWQCLIIGMYIKIKLCSIKHHRVTPTYCTSTNMPWHRLSIERIWCGSEAIKNSLLSYTYNKKSSIPFYIIFMQDRTSVFILLDSRTSKNKSLLVSQKV